MTAPPKAAMPTTETNARVLASRKGYDLEVSRDGAIVARAPGGVRHQAPNWSGMLRFLVAAPHLGGDGPGAA